MMYNAIIVGIVFYGVYNLIKVYTDYLLKRKIIRTGHTDQAGILDPVRANLEENRYPTLKWGLVALFAGAGLIITDLISQAGAVEWINSDEAFMPFGIELVCIALGFLIYFFIVSARKKQG